MYKLILIVTLIAHCLASPAEDCRGNIQYFARTGLQIQPVDCASVEKSIKNDESWGVDKQEALQTEPAEEAAITTTEDYDLIRIKEVNALAEPPVFSILES